MILSQDRIQQFDARTGFNTPSTKIGSAIKARANEIRQMPQLSIANSTPQVKPEPLKTDSGENKNPLQSTFQSVKDSIINLPKTALTASASLVPGNKIIYEPPKDEVKQGTTQSTFSDFQNRLVRNETGILPEEQRYSYRKFSGSKAMGDDLGKYQVTEEELRVYSERYIGQNVTPDEFIKSPQLQDMYIKGKYEYYKKQGYSDSEIAWIHRRGITNAPNPGNFLFQQDPYVKKFNEPIDKLTLK
jgi:hypothetical protein